MRTEFDIGVAMDENHEIGICMELEIGRIRIFSSKKVTKEMKEMYMRMEICGPAYRYCESRKNRPFEVDRCAIYAAVPKAEWKAFWNAIKCSTLWARPPKSRMRWRAFSLGMTGND